MCQRLLAGRETKGELEALWWKMGEFGPHFIDFADRPCESLRSTAKQQERVLKSRRGGGAGGLDSGHHNITEKSAFRHSHTFLFRFMSARARPPPSFALAPLSPVLPPVPVPSAHPLAHPSLTILNYTPHTTTPHIYTTNN